MKYIGQILNQNLQQEIQANYGAAIVRVWHPKTIGTMDLRMDRVNIYVDAAGVITEIKMG